ncbi:DUF3466 family protein, partial [Vibrio genomosp. F10 str. 9ZD137]
RNRASDLTCDKWAKEQWDVWKAELDGNTTSNALAFVENGSFNNQYNNVINSLTDSSLPVGNQSIVGGTRNQIVSPISPLGSASANDWKQGRAWAVDSSNTYSVGSIARTATNDQGAHHTSKAAIWTNAAIPVELNWQSGVPARDGERLAQGSMRDIVVSGTDVYA